MPAEGRLGSSFRDPSGFVFRKGDLLLRQVNRSYEAPFRRLMDSGLHRELCDAGLIIPHEEVDLELAQSEDAIAVIKPQRLNFVSYPYEWSFSQLKAAALATLDIQKRTLHYGMTLKDASAYNIQFIARKPVLIDTLSFDLHEEGQPWQPYRQFCQHFVAPLVLMSHVDVRLSKLLAGYIDGIPLDLASRLSKPYTRLNARIAMHLHLHAQMQAKAAKPGHAQTKPGGFGRNALLGLIDSLHGLIDRLEWKPEGTEWANYYDDTNYSDRSMKEKHRLVEEFLEQVEPIPAMVWDLGANNGEFSRIASQRGIETIAWDIDPAAVEKNYLMRSEDKAMLPLVLDLTNPSPAIGWANRERDSLVQRGPADVVMALALIHHLAIGNNVPLSDVAAFMGSIGKWLIIEFVPKDDSQVQRLLATREDVFPNYDQASFERTFEGRFQIVSRTSVADSKRTMYLMRSR
ncbi:MAG: hypothetical protein P4L46_15820 [Fimbriimonas sp.]|nr:hypothetical protein [Fimbriimonas sp.]